MTNNEIAEIKWQPIKRNQKKKREKRKEKKRTDTMKKRKKWKEKRKMKKNRQKSFQTHFSYLVNGFISSITLSFIRPPKSIS